MHGASSRRCVSESSWFEGDEVEEEENKVSGSARFTGRDSGYLPSY